MRDPDPLHWLLFLQLSAYCISTTKSISIILFRRSFLIVKPGKVTWRNTRGKWWSPDIVEVLCPTALSCLYVAEFALMMCFVYSPYALAEVQEIFLSALKFRITVENDLCSNIKLIPDRQPVLRIHALTNGSGSGSCYYCRWPSRRQQKTNFLTVFLLITFWRDIYIIFQR
jgi:hypothetical protein